MSDDNFTGMADESLRWSLRVVAEIVLVACGAILAATSTAAIARWMWSESTPTALSTWDDCVRSRTWQCAEVDSKRCHDHLIFMCGTRPVAP